MLAGVRHAMKLFTVGFTRKSARQFFDLLRQAGVRRVLDVRLNNVSQLAGFAKRDDLAFFLQEIAEIGYQHMPVLAPTQAILDPYRKAKPQGWADYERRFLDLLRERQIEKELPRDLFAGACLLCSEEKPHHCHRRLVAEYLRQHWGGLDIVHLETPARTGK